MNKKLYIKAMKQPYGLYYQELTVFLEDFNSEEELIRHVFDSCGEGEYYIQTHKRNGDFSKALWKGFIKDLGSDTIKFGKNEKTICYQNRLEEPLLENMGIDQRKTGSNQKIKF